MHNRRIQLDPAPLSAAVLMRDHDHGVTHLDQQLGLDPEFGEALEPGIDEPLEALGTAVHAGVQVAEARLPLHLRIEQLLEHPVSPRFQAS